MSTLIIGAGLCGLWTAHRLTERGFGPVTILEKSRGVGGRMATRRTTHAKFDHGAQFYSVKPAMRQLHEQWSSMGLVLPWMERDGVTRARCLQGMTALAKNLAGGLDVRLETKVVSLESTGSSWIVHLEDGRSITGKTIVLTCPLPQSLDLMRVSQLEFSPDLTQIPYAKAIVGLFEGVTSKYDLAALNGYADQPAGHILSIADQRRKGLCDSNAWAVAMNPSFSEQFFEADDSILMAKVVEEMTRVDASFTFAEGQIKKWRYSHPLKTYPILFAQPVRGLYLAGDAFGGPSLNGAIASANALLHELLRDDN